jgi:hypothetical protein
MPLGGVDATEAAPPGSVPSGGASAGVASWRATFERMGLRPGDLALLGPDVICADEGAATEMLRTDDELRKALDELEAGKRLLTRTTYEVPYGRAFEKARARVREGHACAAAPARGPSTDAALCGLHARSWRAAGCVSTRRRTATQRARELALLPAEGRRGQPLLGGSAAAPSLHHQRCRRSSSRARRFSAQRFVCVA